MNRKKVGLVFILFALFFGTMVTNGMGFTQAPTLIDPGGDEIPTCTDILKVWVANDATFLRFKFETNGSFNQYVAPIFDAYISIDNSTGMDMGWDLPIDYRIYFEIVESGIIYSALEDYNNGSNNHFTPHEVGLMYYSLSNNNHTLEFGYKIQATEQGKGFLNVSIGQKIYLKFHAGPDSDLAPDLKSLICYVLTEEEGGIPGFNLPFLSLTMLIVITFYLIQKKKAKI
ncbi:MAG TPA: hypothetical protein VMV49_16880 [Candidatus Deferrimicrobium sp.]|nr:hypothetical protein [Candidatus Deferrimicrobium sp.]